MSNMQRRHFEAIAQVIRELPTTFDDRRDGVSDPTYREKVTQEFAEMLETTNPLFNLERFVLACGVRPKT